MLASLAQPASLVCQHAGRPSRATIWQPCGPSGLHGCSQPQRSITRLTCKAASQNGVHAAQVSGSPAPNGKTSIVEGLGSNGDASVAAHGGGGGLAKSDFPKFIQFFRQASPYIAGHRGKTFVIVIPGNVTIEKPLLQSIMSDIAMLHGLGVRLVVVAGAQNLIDNMLLSRGISPAFVGGYRITDRDALNIAIEAAGQVRTVCEQILSKGPAIPMIRRHTKGEGEIHFEPALRVISGNFVAAKRRGIVDGVDFGYTGEVRFTLKDDIANQLDAGNVVLLSNLGFTAAGEVLNCNTCDVGLHAAVELGADKLFVLHLDEVSEYKLPEWLPLSDAQDLLVKKLKDSLSTEQMAFLKETIDMGPSWAPAGPAQPREVPQQAVAMQASRVASRLATQKREDLVVDLDVWSASGLPTAVSTCVVACCKGERGQRALKSMAERFAKGIMAADASTVTPAPATIPVTTATFESHDSVGVSVPIQLEVAHVANGNVVHAYANGHGVHVNGHAHTSGVGISKGLSVAYAAPLSHNGNGVHYTADSGPSYSSQGVLYTNGVSDAVSVLASRSTNGFYVSDQNSLYFNGIGNASSLYGHEYINTTASSSSYATLVPTNGHTHANGSHLAYCHSHPHGCLPMNGSTAIVNPSYSNGSIPLLTGYDDYTGREAFNATPSTPPSAPCTCGSCHNRQLLAASITKFGNRRYDNDDRDDAVASPARLPKGIKRAHLLDARTDGGLLLELYSRDGVGTMISADFYEGIRPAGPTDLDAVHALLKPLEEAGTLVKRSRDDVANMLQDFTVVERENKVLGCALLVPLGYDEDGVSVAEVGAFCIDPAFRGSGRGDSLLDYVEQHARTRGIQRLVLLTTRTADWFEQRDFQWIGPAYASKYLPETRRAKVNPARNSQLYVKTLEAPPDNGLGPGKRIGF